MLTKTRAIIAGAAAAIALGPGATAAVATTAATWTVTPGGPATATLHHPGLAIFADLTANAYLDTCRTSHLTATLHPGAGQPGRGIGQVTGLSLSRCFDRTTYTSSRYPWHLTALSYHPATGTTTGRLSGIHLAYSTPGTPPCAGIVDGTSATAHNGTIRFRYHNATHTLTFTRGGTLHLYHNTCPAPWHNGDQLAFGGSYTLTPAQAITSP